MFSSDVQPLKRHFVRSLRTVLPILGFCLGSAVLAEQVTLTMPDGKGVVTGDLLEFTGTEYVVNTPALGEMRLAADNVVCSGEGCPEPTFQQGAEIKLDLKDSVLTYVGTLIGFADDTYTIESGGVTLTFDADDVICSGDGCPGGPQIAGAEPTEETQVAAIAPPPVRLRPDMVMVGSDRVGQELMPLIVKPFAELLNSTVSEPIEFPEDIAQFIFTPKNGSADPFVLEVESTSSGPGLERLIAGTTDIAMSSRGVEDDEVTALLRQGRGNLRDVSQEYVVAVDSIVMIVNKDNPVDALSRQQLADIYSGRITNWSQVGGLNMPITVIGRPGGSARRIFQAFAYGNNPVITEDMVIIDGGKKLTREVMATPGGIGYSISDNVLEAKAVDLILDCGVRTDATPFKSKSEEYLLGRRLRLYVDNANPKPEVRQLLNLMISPTVDPLVAESGYYNLGLEPDPNALTRLMDAALIGQSASVGRAAQADISNQLRGATRLSLTVRFASDDFTLDSKALRDLDRLVEYLNRPENANRQFILVGFADTVGDYFYNVDLSRRRSEEVLRRMRNHPNGAQLRRMDLISIGFGEAAPVGCNDNSLGRSSNRRVELWVR